MATGDMKNNLRKLLRELKRIGYPYEMDWNAISAGLSESYLPVMHYLFLNYSQDLASYLSDKNYDLFAKSDLNFVETIYRIFIQDFSYKPALTKEKFFSTGFAERKVIFLTDMIKKCRELNNKLVSTRKIHQLRKSRTNLDTKKYQRSTQNVSNEKASLKVQFQGQNILPEMKNNLPVLPAEGKENVVEDCKESEDSNETADIADIPRHPAKSATDNEEVEVPKPSAFLVLTPLKDVNSRGQISISSSRYSYSSIEETVDSPDSPKVTVRIERHGNAIQGVNEAISSEGTINNNEDLELKENENNLPKPAADVRQNNCQGTASHQFQSSQACNECTRLEKTVRNLQFEVDALKSALKESISLNNQLSAREVLLETKTKLIEDKLETFSLLDKPDTEGSVATVTDKKQMAIARDMLLKRSRDKFPARDNKDHSILAPVASSDVANTYSPVKYMDEDSSVPPDFKPLDIRELEIEWPEREAAPPSRTLVRTSESSMYKMGLDPILCDSVYDDDVQIQKDNFLEFADTPLRNVVRNVNKRLEETANILKQSSITAATNPLL